MTLVHRLRDLCPLRLQIYRIGIQGDLAQITEIALAYLCCGGQSVLRLDLAQED
jgi:hypothetical protein